MERYKGVICVTYEELTQAPAGNAKAVMSVPNYKQLVARGRLNVVRTARGLGSYALIEFATMPARFRERFIGIHGNPEDVIRENDAPETIKRDAAARDYYAEYLIPNGDHLPEEKQEEYTINASVLNELIKVLNSRAALRKALSGSTANLWDTVKVTVENLREATGHTLPTNHARLRQKMSEYKKEGYECLISRKFGNMNTAKITKEAGKLIIALRRSKVPVYTVERIFKEYNRIAPERGWKPLKSEQAVRLFLERPDIEPLWYDAVHGEIQARQRYQRKHKTIMPTMRDSLWYGDGTKLNLYYKAYVKGEGWKMRTTQVYEVMDAFSEVLLGYHISDSENFEAQYHAFRMAIETAGQRPFEIATDNQGGHKKMGTTGFLDKIVCGLGRPTGAYNPQSKSIESLFGRLQSQVMNQDWRFTGQNITARSPKSRPNLEFIVDNVEHLCTLEELPAAYAAMREEWNNALHPATGRPRIEMYRESVNPDTTLVGVNDMVEMFWTETERSSTFTSAGITITVDGRKYTYEPLDTTGMPDMEFRRRHTYRQFFVKYDPMDMTRVKLYEETAAGLRFVADAVPYIEVQRNIQEQRPGDMEFIRTQERRNKQERIDRALTVAELEMAYGVAPEQHGLNRPKLQGLKLKAAEEMMDATASTKRRAAKPEPISIGLIDKINSNRTFDNPYEKF